MVTFAVVSAIEQGCILNQSKGFVKRDVEEAEEGCIIRGARGHSSLSDLPFFDMVWSFPIEYMYGLLLGVVLQLKNLWKDKKTSLVWIKKCYNQ